MSVRCITWAWDQARADRVDGRELLTLVALADQADDDGHGFCRLAIICGMTNQSDKTVRRHCKTLEHLGLLTRQRRERKNGRWGVNDYWLPVHQPALIHPNHQRSKGASGQNDRRSDREAGDNPGERATARDAGGQAQAHQRSKGASGQNDRWPEMTGGPAVTGDRTIPVSTSPYLLTCGCARLPEEHELFAELSCAVGSDQENLTVCAAAIPGYQRDYPNLTADDIAEVLRHYGVWYRRVCQKNPGAQKSRFPHKWEQSLMNILSTAQGNKARGLPLVGPTNQHGATGGKSAHPVNESFEGKHYEGDDDVEGFFEALG